MPFERINLGLGIVGTIVGIASLGFVIVSHYQPELFGKKDRFFCLLNEDTQRGGEIWTVMYRQNKKKSQPWLKMVTTLGGNWTPLERCQEIARRLEMYREDGLLELTYRSDPNTPNQEVICAITKKSGEQCPLVITLNPGADGYETLREMSASLIGGEGIYQSSDGKTTYQFSREQPVIYVADFLAEDDR